MLCFARKDSGDMSRRQNDVPKCANARLGSVGPGTLEHDWSHTAYDRASAEITGNWSDVKQHLTSFPVPPPTSGSALCTKPDMSGAPTGAPTG